MHDQSIHSLHSLQVGTLNKTLDRIDGYLAATIDRGIFIFFDHNYLIFKPDNKNQAFTKQEAVLNVQPTAPSYIWSSQIKSMLWSFYDLNSKFNLKFKRIILSSFKAIEQGP